MDISSTTHTATTRKMAEDLFKARVSKGYTITQLAIETGLTESEIRQAEGGRRSLDPNHTRRIQSALR